MKKFFLVLALFSLALAFYGQPAQANLLTNGSFEDTTGFVGDTNDTMILPMSSTTMTGWTVITAPIAWIGPTNPFGLTASNGSYFLDLTSYNDSSPFGGVQQSISTVSGQAYTLEFDLGSALGQGLPDAITATTGLISQTFTSTNTTSTNAWEHEIMTFTATSGTTLISLRGVEGIHYIGLDNVSVSPVAVPLPGAVLLLGGGLLRLVCYRKKFLA